MLLGKLPTTSVAFAGERLIYCASLKSMGFVDSARSWYLPRKLSLNIRFTHDTYSSWHGSTHSPPACGVLISIVWHFRLFSATNVVTDHVIHLYLGAAWPAGRSSSPSLLGSPNLLRFVVYVVAVLFVYPSPRFSPCKHRGQLFGWFRSYGRLAATSSLFGPSVALRAANWDERFAVDPDHGVVGLHSSLQQLWCLTLLFYGLDNIGILQIDCSGVAYLPSCSKRRLIDAREPSSHGPPWWFTLENQKRSDNMNLTVPTGSAGAGETLKDCSTTSSV